MGLSGLILAASIVSSAAFAPQAPLAASKVALGGFSMDRAPSFQATPAASLQRRSAGSPPSGTRMQMKPAALASVGAALLASVPANAATMAEMATTDPGTREVLVFLAKTLIAWGVPVVTIGVVAFFVISSASRGKEMEFEEKDPESAGGGGGLPPFLKGPQRKGEPVEYLKIERLNDKLDSFQYSLSKVEKGRKAALAEKRKSDFERAYGITLGDLPEDKVTRIVKARQEFAAGEERGQKQVEDLQM
eukprot:CAMPEP_0174938728 /NCGR_PEP_ID=MMETSP1355-20121228/64392_1 /TAXON_ID=464990 /ORGANISM="Hemiselmis tepida, Strain CCMP443" /LENGTH=247 /DNA_ID=CAMNT_0016185677 /DNA_START=26 /DNA_END=766 /DNA_ORIENTATION=+